MALQVKASPMWPDAHGRYGVVRPICERGTLPSSGRFRFWNFGQAMLQEWPNDASSHPPWFPPRMQTLALGAEALALRAPRKWGRKRRFKNVVPINSVTLVGFVGSDPEQHHPQGNASKFTVLSMATQRSWKNADGEWSFKTEWHRVVLFRPRLADHVARTIKKGDDLS